MSSLKTLKIEFEELEALSLYEEHETGEIEMFTNSITLDMNQLFRYLPTSTESITIVQLYADFGIDQEGETFDIKELEFQGITTRGGRIDQFVSKHFPNLQSLSLHDCFEENGSIMLPNHDLSCLQVVKSFTDLNVRLVTKDETRFFSSTVGVDYTPPNYKRKLLPLSESDIQNLPYITITCASVKKLIISGREADLKSDPSQTCVE
jgi:hypothetical protein